jgi:hypothetical protein
MAGSLTHVLPVRIAASPTTDIMPERDRRYQAIM